MSRYLRKAVLIENAPIAALLTIFVLAKISSLTTAFWWDEASAYIPPSLAVAEKGLAFALPGGHPVGVLWGHPPILYLVHGALYQVFGISIFPHRVAALVFAVIGLWFTYRLGSLLCGRSTGLCAAFLLACSSMFFAQSTMVMGDLPITSLGVMSVYYLFARRPLAYAISATLMLQTKETALATAVAAAVYELFLARKEIDAWRRILMHAVPIGSLAAFFAIEYLATGSLVQAPYFNSSPFFIFHLSDLAHAPAVIAHQARWVGRVLFYVEGRYVLAGMLLIGFVYWQKFWKREFSLFVLVLVLYWAAFSLIVFLPRYVMPVLPLLYVAACWSVYVVFRSRPAAQYIVAGLAALIFVPFFYKESQSGALETNMQYKDGVAVCQRLSEYLDTNFTTPRIAANFPLTKFLTIPELGYVKTPKQIVGTNTMKLDGPSPADLFVYFSIGPTAQLSALRERAIGPPLRRFEEDGVYAEVYDWRLYDKR